MEEYDDLDSHDCAGAIKKKDISLSSYSLVIN